MADRSVPSNPPYNAAVLPARQSATRFSSDPLDPDRARRELPLAALPGAPGAARRFAAAHLHAWNLVPLSDACVLVISELVTNALKATGCRTPEDHADPDDQASAQIVLLLRRTARRLSCEVWDPTPEPPIPARAEIDDESGRGLLLVTACAAGWDWYTSPTGGKVVQAWWPLPLH